VVGERQSGSEYYRGLYVLKIVSRLRYGREGTLPGVRNNRRLTWVFREMLNI